MTKTETYQSDKIYSELKNLQGWNYVNNAIEKNITLKNFKEVFALMVRIGFEVEKMNHHPEWTNVYNKLTIRLWTHDAGGITEKDFSLAKKIDELIIR
ncbi:MAG: 4a-hydroxytetrahydrobiopterin dehydratase [Bacteroidia bacterium]|nr:4a-hydroxytetrahydrobiopterin dehydratase [Bacteroidia bacterium]